MAGRERHLAALLLFVILGVSILAGCGKKDTGSIDPNIPPETVLSSSPDAGDTVSYRVYMNWFGWDPDGEVTHYLVMWDSLDWISTVCMESTFCVSAQVDTVDSLHMYGYHTFSVKAVDNDGEADPTPATISFSAFNVLPETEIIEGPAGITGSFVDIEWLGSDSDGEIRGYGYVLFERIDFEWVEVASEDSLGADETVAGFGPLAGTHRFEVWACDDQWASDPTPAALEFTCCSGPTGDLRIRSNVFCTMIFRGMDWEESYSSCMPIQILAGEVLSFDWSSDVDLAGYRHAYDDTTSWPAWSISDTHFEVLPEPGTHSLYVSVLDLHGLMIRGRIRFTVVEAGLDNYILIVDDYDAHEGCPPWETDADRTDFYDLLVAPYGERYEWEPSAHTVGGVPQPPDVDALAGASTVVWYADWDNTVLGDLFDAYTHPLYDPLSAYVRVGGNLILCGHEVLGQILSENYPVSVSAADTTHGADFVRDILHVGDADNSGYVANKNAPWDYGYCFYGALPAGGGGFEPVYIDSVGPGGWPEPGKWWLYTSTNPNYTRCGLPGVEKVSSFQGTAQEFLTIDSFLNMEYEGEPCALLYLSGDDHGNVCYCGFPLYYLQTPQAEQMVHELLDLFGEERW